jgi:L-asparaginase
LIDKPNGKGVSVLGLGGTISMVGDQGVAPKLTADDLVRSVPQLADGPPVQARNLMTVPGANLTFEALDEVAEAVRGELSDGSTGVVVIQGTDTIEETAFALDILLADLENPIVVTGAMRNPTLASADGPGNIFTAVHSAHSPELRGLGVTVLMNDTIHAAVRVQKGHTSRLDAFTSQPHGPLGWFQEGSPVIVDRGRTKFEIGGSRSEPPPRVPILTVTMSPDLDTWDSVIRSGIDALIVEAMGVGHVPASLAPMLVEAARAIPVVLASRTRRGGVHRHTYEFVGSERYLLDGGLVSAGWLDPLKARVLTVLALRGGADDLAEVFAPVHQPTANS